ncbi:MAG: hypothetical protein WCH76_01720 [Candidatus Riflemargulisbacteria bacterium]
MNNKIISADWVNPYASLQKQVTNIVRKKLSRNNGTISQQQFTDAFKNFKEPDKIKNRLFVTNGEQLEWKPEIQTIKDLRQKLGSPDKFTPEIEKAFNESKKIRNRTKYPLLTYSGKANQLPSNGFNDPVYGFAILVRPYTTFTEKGDQAHNDLHLGEHSFACCLHFTQNKDSSVALDFSKETVRIIWGDFFKEHGMGDALLEPFRLLETVVSHHLNNNKLEELIDLILNKANQAVGNTLVIF